MSTHSFDQYQRRNSLIHDLDPRVKVVITLLFIIANALLPDGAWLAFGVAWGLIILVNYTAHLPLQYTLKRSLIVLPFVLAAVTVMFTLPGQPLATWSWAGHTLIITETGFIRFISILIRSWLSVQMAILLTATTSFPDLIQALTHLRVPAILVAIISFMYRYLFVLGDEAMRLMRARAARSAQPRGGSGGTMMWRAKVTGYMVGQLLLRSLDRSDRVYHAMLSRGYNGRLLTLNTHHLGHTDWLLGGLALLWIGLIQLIGHLL